jgi:hypothetical protein
VGERSADSKRERTTLFVEMKLNTAFEQGWRYCVETAKSYGLVAFDPQSRTLANPDQTVAPVAWTPGDDRRGGAAYRWFSLRSWRWPGLRPLLPLLRRFLWSCNTPRTP